MSGDPQPRAGQLSRGLEYVRLLREMRAKIPLYGEESPDALFQRWQRLRSPHLSLAPQPYDPDWPRWFAEEKQRLASALDERRPAIEHFGSTSIPGLVSKGVVDLAVAVTDPDGLEERLTALGYVAYGNSPVDTQTTWFWRTASPTRVFVAHLCRQGRPWIQRAIDFRDFLRAHPAERERYADLKRKLAADAAGDPLRFSLGKIEIFHEIFNRAASWREAAAGNAAEKEP